MTILYFLVPTAIVLAGFGVWAFYWAVKTGQYDDVETPAIRVLLDDDSIEENQAGGPTDTL